MRHLEHINICVMGVPKGTERLKRGRKIFEEMVKNFCNFMKNINIAYTSGKPKPATHQKDYTP